MNKPPTLLDRAIEFATIAHAGNKRKSGEDFINHPLRVKNILEEIGITDENMLTAAILHAVCSDSSVSIDEIESEFGSDVSYLIAGLSEISAIPIHFDETPKKISNIHKLFIHLSKDIRILIIRLADRLDNIRTADVLKDQEGWIAKKGKHLYAPIAKAIGTYVIAREIENEVLRIENPNRYNQIKKYLDKEFQDISKDLDDVKKQIEKKLDSLGEKYEITYRTKGIYSIECKTNHKFQKADISSPDAFNELYDLLGMRILVNNEETCYRVIAFVQDQWKSIPKEFHDYIANPKQNGYKSIQMAIDLPKGHYCEIQVRTFDMHDFNEYGQASHFFYKYGGKGYSNASWIKALIAQKNSIQHEIASSNKIKLFEDEVFVFTPLNDLISLPKGSTVIDFAYSVHTDLGNQLTGAKVDEKQVSLDTPLESGQTVEIVTAKNRKPSKDWLQIVKTSTAKREIRKCLEK